MPLGFPELAIIFLMVLVLFGAGKLPQVFESMGQGIKKFREAQREDELDVTPPKEIPSKEPPGKARVREAEEVSAKDE